MPEEKVSQYKCLCPCEHETGCIACENGNHDYHLVPPAADAGPRQYVQVERSLLEGILNFMNRRFDGDRLLKHQAHFIGELHRALDTSPPVPQEAAPAPSSNSITVARESFTPTDTQELMKCPTCHGYHIGGCHRATAPDSAMRVAVEAYQTTLDNFHSNEPEAQSIEELAALIREAGSERERELYEGLQHACAELKVIQLSFKLADTSPTAQVIAEAERLLGRESKV